ncbi:hypothetical protein M436DRAFT_75742 [Aureobasidium namibiae CBS 147.97]|uniref:BTB domain-containing protein n=1 Tax=Aureobasidium namibiae CBS 147.97 TaxID=1043004 RepID=A0A074WJI2_9PEZI
MLKRSFGFKDRAGKATKHVKRSFRDDAKLKLMEQLAQPSSPPSAVLNSAIVTIVVGKDQRLFAAHENVLEASPFFQSAAKDALYTSSSSSRRIFLPDEEAEIFSAVLEFMYKGDYFPRLLHDRRRNTWVLESVDECSSLSPKYQGRGDATTVTTFSSKVNGLILRDTAIYCLAEKFGLEELKKLSLRKQGLQSGIEVATILRSARFAYDNTPETDSRLRAHYLALIIRSRNTFRRSGTMQVEMESGGRMFFDLFVAMANHIDDLTELKSTRSPPRVV